MSNVSPRDTEKSGYGYTNNAIDRETSGSDGRAWKIRTDDGNLPKRAAPGNLAPGCYAFLILTSWIKFCDKARQASPVKFLRPMNPLPLTNADEERFLIQRLARSGSQREHAAAQLFARYAPLFHRHFQRHGLHPAEAEELVQEVFILILRGASNYQAGAAPPSAWLWMIARNALISRHRRKEPVVDDEQAYTLALERLVADPEPTDDELADCVRRQFARFAAEHGERAEVLEHIAWHGWKPQDVATLLGRSPGATREYLSQCRKALRPYLEACREWLEET